MNNTIMTIKMWKEENTWMFNDDIHGLIREPFVGETNQALDFIANGSNPTTILFSASDFPGAVKLFTAPVQEYGGATFICEQIKAKCWLCSAMWFYFNKLPQSIYIKKDY